MISPRVFTHIPDGYKVVETPEKVGVDWPHRFWLRRNAERFARRQTRDRLFPSFRCVVERTGRRWAVVAYQNRLEKDDA